MTLRRKFLLAFALTLVLTMSLGNALAIKTISIRDVQIGTPLYVGDSLELAGPNNSIQIEYLDPNGERRGLISQTCDQSRIVTFSSLPEYTIPRGYIKDTWTVCGREHDAGGVNTTYMITVRPKPVICYINYYDASTWMHEQVTTVEEEAVFSSPASKQGHVFKGWSRTPAGDTVLFQPGEEIPKTFLYDVADSGRYCNLYAVWQSTALPDTGDHTSLGMLLTMALLSMAALAAMHACRKETR